MIEGAVEFIANYSYGHRSPRLAPAIVRTLLIAICLEEQEISISIWHLHPSRSSETGLSYRVMVVPGGLALAVGIRRCSISS